MVHACLRANHVNGVWGNSANDVFAVGSDGMVLNYDGTDWTTMTSNTSADLRGVWGSSSDHIFAVGSDKIIYYNGADWITVTSLGSGKVLYGVWGSSADNVYVVGSGGMMIRYDGADWTMASYASEDFHGVWGSSANNIFVVGKDVYNYQLTDNEQEEYTLNVTVDPAAGGTVTGTGISCPGDCTGNYTSETTVQLTASPSDGYQFDQWTGCDSTNGNQCTVTMNGAENITAVFTASSKTISLDSPKNPTSVTPGEIITIRWTTTGASPQDRIIISMKRDSVPESVTVPDNVNWYRFTEHSSDNSDDGEETVVVPFGLPQASDWRFYVGYDGINIWHPSETFQLNQADSYTITATAGSHGSISPAGVVGLSPMGICSDCWSQKFTMTPDDGYEVADVLVDGVSVGAVTSHTLDGREFQHLSNHTIHVTFKESDVQRGRINSNFPSECFGVNI